MLEKLDSIAWSSLSHAYGEASDVPELMRALVRGGTFKTDEDPIYQMYGNIWHQGTVYEATAYAVPFLIEIAESSECNRRDEVLHLLSCIYNGTSYLEVHRPLFGEPFDEVENARLQAELQAELKHVAAAKKAVEAGIDNYLRIFREETDPTLKISAAHLLSNFPERREILAPLIRDALLISENTEFQAGYIILLGQIGDDSPATEELLKQKLLDTERSVQVAAVICAALTKSPLISSVDIELLKDSIEISGFFENLPWDCEYDVDSLDWESLLDEDTRARLAK